MNTRLKLVALAALTIVMVACHNGKDDSAIAFTLEGQLASAADRMLYIEEITPDNGAQFVDSLPCDHEGRFRFKGSATYQTFFSLNVSADNCIVLLPADGEQITISGNADELATSYRVQGSPESQLMWQLQSYINQAKQDIAALAQQDQENHATLSEAEYERAHAVTDSIFLAQRQVTYLMFRNFIDDNTGSLTTLFAIDAPYNLTGRVFYAENDFDLFEQVLDGLLQQCPDNPHTQYFQTRVERERSARMLMQQQQQDQTLIIE